MAEIKTVDSLIKEISSYYKKKGAPSREYKLTYNSSAETLEPVYFWILDFMNSIFGGKVDKLYDNFSSTAGSGHFSELMGKATRMQEEAMKIYGTVNTVIKSILNIIYDLKEFQMRLKQYDDLKNKNKEISQASLLGLKQVWMDQVDIKKGRGSINMLTQELNFVTLRDAFMAADSLDDVKKLDLNDRVKRILEARLQEFLDWIKRSEVELRKRFEIEKTYLRTQVDAVKLYSKWARPYLIAAEQLRMKQQDLYKPDLVNVFNTLYLELTLFGRKELDVLELSANHELPETFKKIKIKRPYYSCVLVEFNFRGIPQRVSQQGHFAFGGKVEVIFRGYALNKDEYTLLKKKIEEATFADSLNLIEGATSESLDQLKEDIEGFLNESPENQEAEKAAQAAEQDINPFSALFGLGAKTQKNAEKSKSPKSEEESLKKLMENGVEKDNYTESVLRGKASKMSEDDCFSVYDTYKKAHDMASTFDKI